MAVLTDADMSRLSLLFERLIFKDTCTILEEVRTPTASGGFTSSWQTKADGVKCAVLSGHTGAGSTPSERVVAGQTVGGVTQQVLLPRGTDIAGNNRLRVGDVTYHVIDLYDPSTYEVVRRVLVSRSSLPGGR